MRHMALALGAALLLSGCGLVPRGSALGNMIGKTDFVDQAHEKCQRIGYRPGEADYRPCVAMWSVYLEEQDGEDRAASRAAYGAMIPAGAAISRAAQPVMPASGGTCFTTSGYVQCH